MDEKEESGETNFAIPGDSRGQRLLSLGLILSSFKAPIPEQCNRLIIFLTVKKII